MSHKLVPWSLSVEAFGLIITSGEAQGSWKITLVCFIHAQDGSLVTLNMKCLYGILNIYILPALLSAVSEIPESIASKLLGFNAVNNLICINLELKMCYFTLLICWLKISSSYLYYISFLYICLDMVMFHHHLSGKSALWRATSAPFSACKIYSTQWILTYAYLWAW